MRIAYLVHDASALDDPTRSAVIQANSLAAHHDVRLLTVAPVDEPTDAGIDPAVTVRALGTGEPDPRLAARESALVPSEWDRKFDAATDVALEGALPSLDVDVVVSVNPGLLVAAVDLLPDDVVVVHQDHRSSGGRSSGSEPLLRHVPRADVLVVPSAGTERWFREQLGDLTPHTVVLPPPLPGGYAPRSTLDSPLIMAAGRLVPEKQYPLLVTAFAAIADEVPQWRLRICGKGPERHDLVRQIRKWDLWDRVELPGAVPDLRAEWAKASVGAVSSRAEGFPLSIQQAMAAGVPVASFDCGTGPREIVEHEHNGLLVGPQSVTGLSAALLRLTTDTDLRHRLGEGAARTAHRYSAPALAERWVAVFADARARRAGRGRLRARAEARAPGRHDHASGTEVREVTPAQARHHAMAAVAAAARSTGAAWLVMPAHERPAPTAVLPMGVRDRFLEALSAADLPAYLCLREPAENNWPERSGPVREMAADLRRGRTSVVYVEPWPSAGGAPSHLGQGCSVEVQFWESTPEGDLVAPRRNPYADRIPALGGDSDLVDVEVEGVEVPTLLLMAAPTATECRFPVDVVYTWVDGSDPVWNAAREERLAGITGTAQTRESSGQARFLARDELRYSFRSLHLFAPWVRRIHLVTAGQVPEWLDTDHPMVNLVDHRDILPAEALPTFNSHAIETALHRIDGLAEHFVYFNDDFLLGRPVRPEAFFAPGGQYATFFSPLTIGLSDLPDAAPYLKAAWNNRTLLQEELGAVTTTNLAHAPYPHRVSVLEELTARFPEALAGTARSPFRNDTDVSTLSSLAQHYGLLTGSSYVGEADLAFVNLSNADVKVQLQQVLARDQDFICLGDHHDHALRAEQLDSLLADFYTAYYPVAAPWERT